MPAGALGVGCQRRTWGFVEGLDASGALGVRGCQRCTWGFVEVSDASGRTWGFVEGSDASGALGGSWRDWMPAVHLGFVSGSAAISLSMPMRAALARGWFTVC